MQRGPCTSVYRPFRVCGGCSGSSVRLDPIESRGAHRRLRLGCDGCGDDGRRHVELPRMSAVLGTFANAVESADTIQLGDPVRETLEVGGRKAADFFI
jgi:hypothetical protein